jgi:RNA polymerase sigma-70 factor (ECF subfamily)
MIEFATFYRDHAADVYRFALFLCGDRTLAEDIVSETFVRVWGARERVEIRTVRAYLLAIARNLYLHGLRRERRRADLDETVVDPGRRVDDTREARDELNRVLARLQELPEVDRSALLMRAEENLSYEEIAAALGISPVAARVKVHRARAKLSAAREEPGR